MKIHDLQLDESIGAFRTMTEPYYKEFLSNIGRTPDWMDSMVWSKLVAEFKSKIDNNEITGREANTRYWIRLFRKDVDNVSNFMDTVKA